MDIPPVAFLGTLAVTCLAVFGAFYIFASRYLYELALDKLRQDAMRLRREYAERIEAMRRAGAGEASPEFETPEGMVGVDILPDPPEMSQAA